MFSDPLGYAVLIVLLGFGFTMIFFLAKEITYELRKRSDITAKTTVSRPTFLESTPAHDALYRGIPLGQYRADILFLLETIHLRGTSNTWSPAELGDYIAIANRHSYPLIDKRTTGDGRCDGRPRSVT